MNQTTINKFDVSHRMRRNTSPPKKPRSNQLKPQLNSEEESKSNLSRGSSTSRQENSQLPFNDQGLSTKTFSRNQEEISISEEASEAQGRGSLTPPALLAQRGEISLNSNEPPGQEVEIGLQRRHSQTGYAQRFLAGFCERTAAVSFLRKSYVFILSVFVCSSAALASDDLEKLVPLVFLVSYFCLLYQVVEDLAQYLALRNASEKVETIFELVEGVSLIVFLASLNLYYYSRAGFGEICMLFVPPLFLGETVLYMKKSSLSQTEKETKVIVKILYLIQSSLIAVKINNLSDFDWKWTLLVLWIYLGANACYIVFAGLLLISVTFASVLQMNTEILSALKTKILGYIWHLCFYSLNAIALVILLGIFQRIENASEENFLQFGLESAKNLSFFLLIYTILAFPFLKESHAGPFHDFASSNQGQDAPNSHPRQTHKLNVQSQNKTAFFLMISPTYYVFLKSGPQPPIKKQIQKAKKKLELVQESSQDLSSSNNSSISEIRQKQEDIVRLSPKKGGEKEENLCYICENNISNAILTECGHGGVCCDCTIKSIEQKNECMGCRKPVGAIYKVEESSKKLGVVKAHEIIQVMAIDD